METKSATPGVILRSKDVRRRCQLPSFGIPNSPVLANGRVLALPVLLQVRNFGLPLDSHEIPG